jgi:hypothetical protein
MRQLALACISTSLLLAGSLAAQEAAVAPAAGTAVGPAVDPAAAAYAEMEVSLAKLPKVYLALDPQRRVLEIKARGAVLDRVILHGIELLSQQSPLRRSLPIAPSVPGLWVVKVGPGDTDREVVAPKELRPEPKDEELGSDKDAEKTQGVPAGPTPTPTPFPEAPTSYRVQLANGWDLWVTTQLPPQGRLQMYLAALADGWRRLHGHATDLAPAITLLMGEGDARRLHHLFRTGTEILVGPGTR